jgi:ABC-type antimicrobial peptide transport system permease subunit
VIALFIAAVGVYGVVYYTVAQRTKEIGLRVALGAGRAQVVGPMLRQVAVLSLIGIGIGLFGAWEINPIVANLLLNVSPTDPLSFAIVSVLLAVIALVATWIPAWRVGRQSAGGAASGVSLRRASRANQKKRMNLGGPWSA